MLFHNGSRKPAVSVSGMDERVAFLGLGIMGSRMATNLFHDGFEMTVWNRTPEKADAWVEANGGNVAATPAEAATNADFVVSMVVDGSQVEAVLLGPDGAAETASKDTLFIDMSTIGPVWARKIGGELLERGLRFIDAPVTGSAPRAAEATLTIMAGGDPDDFGRAMPLFETIGSVVEHVGGLGDGQAIKLINNTLAAANATALAEALVLARASELDLEALLKIVNAGSGASAMAELKSQAMIDHDFSPLFKTDHMLKDIRLCLEQARHAGLKFKAALHAEAMLDAASRAGHGEEDFASLIVPVEESETVQR